MLRTFSKYSAFFEQQQKAVQKTVHSLPVSTQTNKQHSTAIHVVWDKAVKPEEWAKVVMDKDKNVVVWFMSPWSGHCKRFGPTFEALARAHAKKEATTRTPCPGPARPACPRVTDSAVVKTSLPT